MQVDVSDGCSAPSSWQLLLGAVCSATPVITLSSSSRLTVVWGLSWYSADGSGRLAVPLSFVSVSDADDSVLDIQVRKAPHACIPVLQARSATVRARAASLCSGPSQQRRCSTAPRSAAAPPAPAPSCSCRRRASTA